MQRTDFLLIKLMEECCEAAQRASKQIQFGRDEVQEGQSLTNGQRLREEVMDVIAIAHLLSEEGFIEPVGEADMAAHVLLKREKLIKYLHLSYRLGMVRT